jgi:hypothetical protein
VNQTMPSRFAELLKTLRERGEVTRAGKGWLTLCPAHDDQHPSLSIKLGDGERLALVNCRAGCDPGNVLASINMKLGDLFF